MSRLNEIEQELASFRDRAAELDAEKVEIEQRAASLRERIGELQDEWDRLDNSARDVEQHLVTRRIESLQAELTELTGRDY